MPRLILALNGGSVFQQPAILLFLRFEKAKQSFLRASGTGRLNLFLDSSLQRRIADFYLHRPLLRLLQGIGLAPSLSLLSMRCLPRFAPFRYPLRRLRRFCAIVFRYAGFKWLRGRVLFLGAAEEREWLGI